VTCACTAFRTNSYSLSQQLWASGALRATFDCVMVLLAPDRSEKLAVPQAIRDRFIRVDGAVQEG